MVEVCGYTITVVKSNLWRARVVEGGLEVSLPLLRADANASIAGERLAGPLLLDYRFDECSGRLREEVSRVAESYRSRVVVEQLYDLLVRMGPLAREACVDPLYPLASRLRLIGGAAPCPEPGEVGRLRRIYSDLLPARDGCAPLEPHTVRARFRGVAARVRATFLSAHIAVPVPEPPWASAECRLPEPLGDPWGLVSLPEGEYRGPCPGDVLGLFGVEECRPAPRFASTQICLRGGRRVVVKDYIKMSVKWIPAALASSVAVRYRLGPRSRLAADYRYLRLLRTVLPTPRFHAVCSDIAKAAAVRDYVEGAPVLDSGDEGVWRLAGEALGAVHEAGYSLGDSNPGNFIYEGGGRLWLVDAEQARGFTLRRGAWDIVVALAYSTLFRAGEGLLRAMLEGYESSWAGARRILELASTPTLWLPLSTVPQVGRGRRVLKDYLRLRQGG